LDPESEVESRKWKVHGQKKVRRTKHREHGGRSTETTEEKNAGRDAGDTKWDTKQNAPTEAGAQFHTRIWYHKVEFCQANATFLAKIFLLALFSIS
jgi:hypothetical protein